MLNGMWLKDLKSYDAANKSNTDEYHEIYEESEEEIKAAVVLSSLKNQMTCDLYDFCDLIFITDEKRQITVEYIKPKKNINKKPNRKNTYFCRFCKSIFYSSYSKNLHIKDKHNDKLTFPCVYQGCLVVYSDERSRSRHIVGFHNKDKDLSKRNVLKCFICNYIFDNKDELAEHMNLHKEGDYFCCLIDSCNKKYSNVLLLSRHVKVNHFNLSNTIRKVRFEELKAFNCQFCDKALSQKYYLDKHEKICKKNPNKDNQMLICRFCSKALANYKHNLIVHEISCKQNPNREEYLLSCQFCNKKFNKFYLTAHKKTCKSKN